MKSFLALEKFIVGALNVQMNHRCWKTCWTYACE